MSKQVSSLFIGSFQPVKRTLSQQKIRRPE